MHLRTHLRAPLLLFVLLALEACVPDTPYRYSAMVPPVRPMTWDGRTAKAGTLRIEGNVAGAGFSENFAPQLHDTALLVPKTTLGGTVTLALTPGFEVGVRGTYAAYGWSKETAAGTQPLPSAPSLSGAGPELRGTIAFGSEKRFAIGMGANYLLFQTPYAEWQLTGPDSMTQPVQCTPSPTCVDGYSLAHEGSEGRWTFNAGIYPSYAVGEGGKRGRVFGMVGVHTGYKNDGFTDTSQSGSTVQEFTAGLVGAGYGIEFDIVHVSAMLFHPFAGGVASGVAYTIGGFLAVGVDLPLWKAKEESQEQQRAIPPESLPAPSPPPVEHPAQPVEPSPSPEIPM